MIRRTSGDVTPAARAAARTGSSPARWTISSARSPPRERENRESDVTFGVSGQSYYGRHGTSSEEVGNDEGDRGGPRGFDPALRPSRGWKADGSGEPHPRSRRVLRGP